MSTDRVGKIVLIGNTAVGKTCVVRKATMGIFDSDSETTLAASYTAKSVTVGDQTVRLQIWDTAGQEKYRSMTPMYYQNAQIGLVVYSVCDRSSFEGVNDWVLSLKQEADPALRIFLVANKIDLLEERVVTTAEGVQKAQEINAKFYEVSALTGEAITELFDDISESCLLLPQHPKDTTPLNSQPSASRKSKCC